MSGQRWSIPLLLLVVSVTGCKSSESSRFGWKFPGNKATPKLASGTEEASEWSEFRESQRGNERGAPRTDGNMPVAEERLESLLSQGQMALQDNRLDDARLAYTRVLDASPDNATAHHGMAMAADLSQRWSDAEYHYRQALRIRPRDANLLCDIGYSYLLQNRYSEASSYLNQALEINPEHESAFLNLALLDLRQGNRRGAETRIASRFGNSARGAQVLAQLDQQTSAVMASFRADDFERDDFERSVPANATFEQVQEIARRERIEAERRRATQNIPQGPVTGFADVQPVSVLSNQSPPVARQPQEPPFGRAESRAPVLFPTPEIQPRTMWQNEAGVQGTALPSSLAQASWPMSPSASTHAQNVATDAHMTADGSFQSRPSSILATAMPGTLPHASGHDSNRLDNSRQVQTGAAGANPASPPAGLHSSAGIHPSEKSSPVGSSAVSNEVSPAFAQSSPRNPSDLTQNTHGRVVQVHSSGVFERPGSGSVSYGQPLGFSSQGYSPRQTSASPSFPPGGSTMSNVGNGSDFNGRWGSSSFHAPPVKSTSGNAGFQQYSSGENTAPPVYVDGLNAGPGAIFPVGYPSPGPVAHGEGIPMHSGAAAVSSSAVPRMDAASVPLVHFRPDSSLAGQVWMQQQVAKQQSERMAHGQSQYQQYQQPHTPVSSPAFSPSPSSPPGAAAPNPLESYEQQRRQLDSDYNRTLQQMGRGPANSIPAFP